VNKYLLVQLDDGGYCTGAEFEVDCAKLIANSIFFFLVGIFGC
jgi:hypothetical protein